MIAKIIEAPLSDHLSVDARTGLINVVKLPGALVSVGSNEIIRHWAVTWYGLWESHATGTSARAKEIKQAVLNSPDVAEKIRQAEQQADTLNECLISAKSIRERLASERMAEKNRLEQEAAERRKDQLDKFVADHMTETQQRRYAAGLMAESEIIDAIEDKTFAHLAPYVEYSRIKDQDVTEHVLNALGLDVDYLEYEVSYGKRALQSATDDEFNRTEQFNRLLPSSSLKLFQRFGYLDQYAGDADPELIVNTCEITVQVGEFAVSREYLL